MTLGQDEKSDALVHPNSSTRGGGRQSLQHFNTLLRARASVLNIEQRRIILCDAVRDASQSTDSDKKSTLATRARVEHHCDFRASPRYPLGVNSRLRLPRTPEKKAIQRSVRSTCPEATKRALDSAHPLQLPQQGCDCRSARVRAQHPLFHTVPTKQIRCFRAWCRRAVGLD